MNGGSPLPVAIVDTSSLYSDGQRRTIVGACNGGKMIAVWSPHIIAELCRVLTIAWIEDHGSSPPSRRQLSRSAKNMMDVLTKAFELIDTAPVDDEDAIDIRDHDDHHLVRAARRAEAGYVVSENTRDFPLPDEDGRHMFEGIEFLTPRAFFLRFGIK